MNIASVDELQKLIDELQLLGVVKQYPDKSSVLTKNFYVHLCHTYNQEIIKASGTESQEENELDGIIISLLSFIEQSPLFLHVKPSSEPEWIYSASLLIYSYIKIDQVDSLKESYIAC